MGAGNIRNTILLTLNSIEPEAQPNQWVMSRKDKEDKENIQSREKCNNEQAEANVTLYVISFNYGQ